MTSSPWFPKVSEWRGLARQIERERVEAQRARFRKLPVCPAGQCNDTGWVTHPQTIYESRQPVRLPDEQRRLEVLGRIPLHADLPATECADE